MPNRRRQAVRRVPVRARRPRASRSQTWFSVLALVTVVSMLIGAVGSAVFLDLFDSRNDQDNDISIDPADEDPTEQEYREDVAARPDDPEALARLANHLSLTGKGDEALGLFEDALAIAPDNTSIRLNFAEVLADAGANPDAELQFDRIIAAEPQNGLALLNLARLYRDWSPPRPADAISTYQRVTALDGDSSVIDTAWEELAELGVATPVAASPVPTPAG